MYLTYIVRFFNQCQLRHFILHPQTMFLLPFFNFSRKKKPGVHPEKQEVEEEYIASVQIRRPPYIPPTLPPQIHRYGYSWHLKYHPPSLP